MLVDKLEQSFLGLQQEIAGMEKSLKKHGMLTEVIATGMCLWTESYYFKFAENYFASLHDLDETSVLAGIPILKGKLTDNYLSFLTTLGSVLMLGVDNKFIGIAGVSCSLLSTVVQLLSSDLESIVNHLQGIVDDQQIAEISPYVEQLLGFGLNAILYSITFGVNAGMFGALAAGFLAASACRKVVGEALDWMYGEGYSKDKGWNLLVKQPVQHMASIMAHNFAANASLRFFAPALSKEQLLADEKYCLQDVPRCRKEALKFLGLPESATTIEVEKASRKLTLKYHPDRTYGADPSQMVMLSQVKGLLKKIDDISKFTP